MLCGNGATLAKQCVHNLWGEVSRTARLQSCKVAPVNSELRAPCAPTSRVCGVSGEHTTLPVQNLPYFTSALISTDKRAAL